MSKSRNNYIFNPFVHNDDFEHATGFLNACTQTLNRLVTNILEPILQKEDRVLPRELGKKIKELEKYSIVSGGVLQCFKDVVHLRNAFVHGSTSNTEDKLVLNYREELIELSNELMQKILRKHQNVHNKLIQLTHELGEKRLFLP